jgi:hypothetical protein
MVGMTRAGVVSTPLFVPDASHIPYYPFVKTLATVLLHFPELDGCDLRGTGLEGWLRNVNVQLPAARWLMLAGRDAVIGRADVIWKVDWNFRFVKAMACG